ncbi:MAG TPA: protein kinase [Candidatus Brocadiales bacterium]|nr:protein kinase [Candidatus Brocadiales bacterium]
MVLQEVEVRMFVIKGYKFQVFNRIDGHRANYAVLDNSFTVPRGIKYSPDSEFSHEFNILSKLSHEQIPHAYDIGQGDLYEDGRFIISQNFVVLEHFPGVDLVEYYKEKNMLDTKRIDTVIKHFITLCDPLQYLHEKGYIHGDIKPGHLLLNRNTDRVCLVDFECAIKKGELVGGCTREYASPEQKLQMLIIKDFFKYYKHPENEATIFIDGRTDLYSLGVVLYQILTNKLWNGSQGLPSHINKEIPQRLDNIVLGLLETKISDRISSAEELKRELNSVLL